MVQKEEETMTIWTLLVAEYPTDAKTLKEKFPGMAKTAEETIVVPWNPSYAIADKNPEVITELERLEELLKMGDINEETYNNLRRKLLKNYASLTLAIAFQQEKKVAFRKPKPSLRTILHELGHIHFKAGDLLWSAAYGGAEILFWVGFGGAFKTTEKRIQDCIALIDTAFHDPEKAHSIIIERLRPFWEQLDIVPHVGALLVAAGTIPDIAFYDSKDSAWQEVPATTHLISQFITNVLDGLRFKDPWFVTYARYLGWIEDNQDMT